MCNDTCVSAVLVKYIMERTICRSRSILDLVDLKKKKSQLQYVLVHSIVQQLRRKQSGGLISGNLHGISGYFEWQFGMRLVQCSHSKRDS